MSALVFDTHAFVKKLKEAGLTEQQAEIQADVLTKAFEQFKESLRWEAVVTRHDLKESQAGVHQALKGLEATTQALEATLKRDMKELEITLKRDMKELEVKMETKLAELKAELLKWIIGLLLAQTGLIAALVKLL